jgi:hypothetical protein
LKGTVLQCLAIFTTAWGKECPMPKRLTPVVVFQEEAAPEARIRPDQLLDTVHGAVYRGRIE